jgi:hypothetical protein
MHHLLGAAIIGVQHAHRGRVVVAAHVEHAAKWEEVGEQHGHRAKLAGVGFALGLDKAARQAARQVRPQRVDLAGEREQLGHIAPPEPAAPTADR